MASSGEKSPAVGHVSGFQIDPRKIKQYLSVEKPASSEEKNAVWARIYHMLVAAACGLILLAWHEELKQGTTLFWKFPPAARKRRSPAGSRIPGKATFSCRPTGSWTRPDSGSAERERWRWTARC